jgi:hypothetical protein
MSWPHNVISVAFADAKYSHPILCVDGIVKLSFCIKLVKKDLEVVCSRSCGMAAVAECDSKPSTSWSVNNTNTCHHSAKDVVSSTMTLKA